MDAEEELKVNLWYTSRLKWEEDMQWNDNDQAEAQTPGRPWNSDRESWERFDFGFVLTTQEGGGRLNFRQLEANSLKPNHQDKATLLSMVHLQSWGMQKRVYGHKEAEKSRGSGGEWDCTNTLVFLLCLLVCPCGSHGKASFLLHVAMAGLFVCVCVE